jgi:hypothetical protein
MSIEKVLEKIKVTFLIKEFILFVIIGFYK